MSDDKNIIEKLLKEPNDFQQHIPNPSMNGYSKAGIELSPILVSLLLNEMMEELERMCKDER